MYLYLIVSDTVWADVFGQYLLTDVVSVGTFCLHHT
jgi:hypothetical protein